MEQVVEKLIVTDKLKELVKEKLIKNNNEDVHQVIIDMAYNHYQNYLENINQQLEVALKPCERWNYYRLCEITREDFGTLAEFAVLIGKYNYQVENGGHEQYWFNEYASINSRYKDLYLHMNLVDYFETFGNEIQSLYPKEKLDEINKALNKTLNIMRDFPESIQWITKVEYAGFDSQGEFTYGDPEDDYNELSDYSKRRLSYLDSDYYKINQALMDILNLYFKNCIYGEVK